MRRFSLLLFILFAFSQAFAQVTPNPKINRKSAQNVFINKIEITVDYTIFHMQFYDKDGGSADFERFMRENPDLERRLRSMGLTKEQAEQLYKERFSTQQTISFQPSSKIVLSNGKEYNFIKATNIPVAPERKNVESGQKYFFKVYFEKIPPGFELIDLIEHDIDSDGTMQFWNFDGIHINNPKDRKPVEDTPVEKEEVIADGFRLFGRVLDAKTEQPINAKLVCSNSENKQKLDSLQTSKTGKYEFVLNTNEIAYEVSSSGYETLSENLNLTFFVKKGSLEKDIYLMPKPDIKQAEVEVSADSIGEKIDEKATTFKLNKVYFNLGQAVILEQSFEQLNSLAKYLVQNPDLKIQIEGHTDNQGDPKANQKLSLDRAYNVREYLVSKGVDGKRIKFRGNGSKYPVAPNDTEENRSKNRRVEYKFID